MLSLDDARHLDRLAIAAGTASAASGRRAIRARGDSLEFHDFRPYEPGDDPRAIDWTIDARLNQLVVRTFRAEGHVPVHVLVDTSASMGLGAPTKLAAAAKAASSLAYVAVRRRDPVFVGLFAHRVDVRVEAAGRMQLRRALDALAAARPSGPSMIDSALAGYSAKGPGLAVVFSDFFDSSLTLDGLRWLLYRGLRVALVQVLSDDEIDPPVGGETLELIDVEDTGSRSLIVDRSAVAGYKASLARATQDLERFCNAHGVPFIRHLSTQPFDRWLSACTGAGLLEVHS